MPQMECVFLKYRLLFTFRMEDTAPVRLPTSVFVAEKVDSYFGHPENLYTLLVNPCSPD